MPPKPQLVPRLSKLFSAKGQRGNITVSVTTAPIRHCCESSHRHQYANEHGSNNTLFTKWAVGHIWPSGLSLPTSAPLPGKTLLLFSRPLTLPFWACVWWTGESCDQLKILHHFPAGSYTICRSHEMGRWAKMKSLELINQAVFLRQISLPGFNLVFFCFHKWRWRKKYERLT